jgi:hypothetical protein
LIPAEPLLAIPAEAVSRNVKVVAFVEALEAVDFNGMHVSVITGCATIDELDAAIVAVVDGSLPTAEDKLEAGKGVHSSSPTGFDIIGDLHVATSTAVDTSLPTGFDMI